MSMGSREESQQITGEVRTGDPGEVFHVAETPCLNEIELCLFDLEGSSLARIGSIVACFTRVG